MISENAAGTTVAAIQMPHPVTRVTLLSNGMFILISAVG